ncbi:DUF1295 domain-containing protein [Oscillatoria salina IIICB1]|nr:DUF1295 domain-containing protein [Oscillatoria salina IIICB1]NET90313.1 DUF1295 domain-containing protein [Kamptonema sp. SIO1D9]
MENTNSVSIQPITQLTAINVAKILTILILITLSIIFGVRDWRQVVYLCLHISYCLWWLIEQGIYPQRREIIFNEPADTKVFISIVLFVGVFYSLPGYLAFTNPEPLGFIACSFALPLFIFGSLINAIADVQKLTAKQYGADLIVDNIWRFARHINYFGDLLRYLSFSIVAGSLWAYLVPAVILLLYLQRISQKEDSMAKKYPDYTDYQEKTARLIPFIW